MVITLAPITNVKPISGINVHKHSSLTNIISALVYSVLIPCVKQGFCLLLYPCYFAPFGPRRIQLVRQCAAMIANILSI